MIPIIFGGVVAYLVALGLVLAFMACAAPPCTCPVTFARYMQNERCLRDRKSVV